ncbi:hypothetical protein SF285071_5251 [Shigella flexneri 2850-71]|nr:hypothetical protein SF285071_5251 [Shigella flexneri 2850-71]
MSVQMSSPAGNTEAPHVVSLRPALHTEQQPGAWHLCL